MINRNLLFIVYLAYFCLNYSYKAKLFTVREMKNFPETVERE